MYHSAQSIKYKLLFLLFSTIAYLIVIDTVLFAAHFFITAKYRAINSNMITEQRIVENMPQLIESYYQYLTTPYSTQRKQAYETNTQEMTSLLTSLAEKIVSPDSQILYKGIRSSIQSYLTGFERNIQDIQSGKAIALASSYEEAKRKFLQLERNVNELLLEEIKYIKVLQAQIDRIETIGILITLAIIGGSVGVMIFIMFHFANKLIDPIKHLSDTAKVISEGNLQTVVDEDLIKRPDEIGSLSTSFYRMLDTLKKKIHEVEESNVRLQRIQDELRTKAEDLEKMNKFMVGRELKMTELKQLLKQTEDKLTQCINKQKQN